MKGLLEDMGVTLGIEIRTDASAAKGIAGRKGLGKVRHMRAQQLWIQDAVREGRIRITKVDTKSNIADIFTKALEPATLEALLKQTATETDSTRHEMHPGWKCSKPRKTRNQQLDAR